MNRPREGPCSYCNACGHIHSPVSLYDPITARQRQYDYPRKHKIRLHQIMKADYENKTIRWIKAPEDYPVGVQSSSGEVQASHLR